MSEANNASAQFHWESKSRVRHRTTRLSGDRPKAEPIPHPNTGVQMGARLSSKSTPQEPILASIKEELVHRLQLLVEPEDINDVTFAAVAAAIQARWLSI
jgi:hypothetical protein